MVGHYIANKDIHRLRLADKLGVDIKTIKKALTAITAGAPFNPTKGALIKMFDYDIFTFAEFKGDLFVRGYVDDMKTLWKSLKPQIRPEGRLTCRDKWMCYFKQERVVMDAITDYLDSKGYSYFIEHDGFVTNKKVNLQQLHKAVKDATMYRIYFDFDEL